MKEPLSVLIIDDDEDMCHLLKRILANRKMHVSTAHSLKEGLHCMEQVNPKVIFLDNNLPDGTGVGFIKKIKAFNRNIQVIMITGDTLEGLKENALKAGVHSFLSKPFSYDLIDKTVQSLSSALPAIFFPLLSVFSFFSESA